MKGKTKQVIAAAAVLALILAASRFLPKSLDKAVWNHKSAPKHVTIINYDAGRPPAVGVTLAEAQNWQIIMIRMDEKSVPGSYNYWVDLQSTEEPFAYKSFSGSYVVNQEGRISNFFIDLEE